MQKTLKIAIMLTSSGEYNFMKSDLRASGFKPAVGSYNVGEHTFDQILFNLFDDHREELVDRDCSWEEAKTIISPVIVLDVDNKEYKVIPLALTVDELLYQGEFSFEFHEVFLDFNTYISSSRPKVFFKDNPFPKAGVISLN